MGRRWYLGTMGFSYKDWSGPFYPPEMPAHKYLKFYGRIFNAVEIDSTFYGTPRRETVLRWKSITPDHFRFCLKTPREITHDLMLAGPQALDSMLAFLESAGLLDEKLGVILLQFSPSFKIDRLQSLAAFLGKLPGMYRYAVEFRHRSWYQPDTTTTLSQFGIGWASTEYPNVPLHTEFCTNHVYIRWIGRHGRFQTHIRERVDMSSSLSNWKSELARNLKDEQEVFGFFNNDYAGFAPATCNKFKALLALPTNSFDRPKQGRLF